MSVSFYFEDIPHAYDDMMYTFGSWIGKYTVGNINIRGTRVWFRPPFVKSFEDYPKETLDKHRKKLLKGEDLGDIFNLRSESLEIILNELKREEDNCIIKKLKKLIGVNTPEWNSEHGCIYYDGTIKELIEAMEIEEYISDNFKLELENETFQFDDILINSEPPVQSVWLITHKNDIISELEFVLNKCEDEGVTWIWV